MRNTTRWANVRDATLRQGLERRHQLAVTQTDQITQEAFATVAIIIFTTDK